MPSLTIQYSAPAEDPNDVDAFPATGMPSPDSIFDKYLQAVGGRARIESLKSIVAKGTYSEHEVVEYRNMMFIIRDRVQAMVKKGATLAQVKSARLTDDRAVDDRHVHRGRVPRSVRAEVRATMRTRRTRSPSTTSSATTIWPAA